MADDPMVEVERILEAEGERLHFDDYEKDLQTTMETFTITREMAQRTHHRFDYLASRQAALYGLTPQVYIQSIPKNLKWAILGMAVGIEMTLKGNGLTE